MQSSRYKKQIVLPGLVSVLLATLFVLSACNYLDSLFGGGAEDNSSDLIFSRDEQSESKDEEESAITLDTAAELFVTVAYQGGVAISDYLGNECHVKIPESINGKNVLSIKSGAFKDSENPKAEDARVISTIIVPTTVKVIEIGAFANCKGIVSLTVPFCGGGLNEHTYIGYVFGAYSSDGNSKAVPQSLQELTVGGVTIHERAFYNCANIKSVILTEAETVCTKAFENCKDLRLLHIPDCATTIGADILKGCTSITTLSLPFLGDGADKQFLGAFFGAKDYTQNLDFVPSSLRTLTVPCFEELPDGAFYECMNIVTLNLKGNLKAIGKKAFYRCLRLKYLNVEYEGYTGINSIDSYSFGYCSNLGEIIFDESITNIPDAAFYGCSSLRSLRFGEKINELKEGVTIGRASFAYCSKMQNLILPCDLSEIPEKAFYGCSYLSEIHIPSTVKNIGKDSFMGCSLLNTFQIQTEGSNGASVIESGALAYCSSLKTIVLPSCVTSIGESAFAFSGIKEIAIKGENVSVSKNAFAGCNEFVVDVISTSQTYNNLVEAGLDDSNFKN